MDQIVETMNSGPTSPPQILLMEDESSVAEGLKMILKEEGYGVDLAATGQKAIDTLTHKGFDLLVADLRLPDMDGLDVIKRIKSRRPETEIIVITGYASVPSAVRAMKTGVIEYLEKPFTDDEFKSAVEEALKEKGVVPHEASPMEYEGTDGDRIINKGEVLRVLRNDSDIVAESEDHEIPFIDTDRIGENYGTVGKPTANQDRLLQQHKMISLGRLAASVAHEINNPLSGILNYIRLMIKILKRGSPSGEQMDKFHRYLDLVEGETARCSELVSSMLAFSRISNLEFSEVGLLELLEKSMLLSQHKLDLQNIEVRTEFDEKIPVIRGNFNQIQQCIINLIFNAIDAMPQGGILTIGCTSDPKDDLVEIRVTDTGTGIPSESLPHIFDPFYTTKAEGEGLGLGLATVYGIIEKHKGSIEVESQIGEGTTFTIKLPKYSGEAGD